MVLDVKVVKVPNNLFVSEWTYVTTKWTIVMGNAELDVDMIQAHNIHFRIR